MRAAGLVLFLAPAILAGCASPPPPPAAAPPHVLDGRIWDVRSGRFIGEDVLAQRLREARFRLLGEVHDHPEHHRLRAGLLARLAPTEVSLEQFDREQDAAVRASQRAGADADALARAGRLDAAWQWPLHRPLVQAALAARLPLRAANLSTADARRIAAAGALGAGDADLAAALAGSDWSPEREAALRRQIVVSHCDALPEKMGPAMALAQRARDAALALALAGAPGAATLIAGNGHVRRDLAVPLYLPREASVVSVGWLETRASESDPRAYARGAGGEAAYDYLWFTAPHPRPDPCGAFGKR